MQFTDYAGASRQLKSDIAKKISFSEIPVIDVSGFISPDATDASKAAVVAQVKNACEHIGFLYISGHGIDTALMDAAFAAARDFFMLSRDEKNAVNYQKSPLFRGFEPSKADGHATGDVKEAFNWGYNDSENAWPPASPALKPAILAYYDACLALGRHMIRIFALALDLPETYFDPAFRTPGALGRILYYPSQAPDASSADVGIRAHSDIECFTFLLQGPDITCLQVVNKDGDWVEAPPIPGTLVMNVGDMLSRWTNGRFVSTVHRVINKSGLERFSIPIFFGPDYDTQVEALATCVPAGETPKYQPISAGDYVYRRLAWSRMGVKYDESVPMEEVRARASVAK